MSKLFHSHPILTLGFAILLFFIQSSSILAKEWNGIVPLKSSRSDVERLLGLPDEMGGYQLTGIYVDITYTPSACSGPNEACECLVGKDIVQWVSVAIQGKLKLGSLNLKLKNYVKKRDSHLLVYDSYTNLAEGVIYTVFREDKTVTNITYWPSQKDCKEILSRGRIMD